MALKATEPIALAHLHCQSRVIRSAVHSFLGTPDGHISENELAMYGRLAKNNLGIIITGHACVMPGGRANPEQTGIYADEFIDDFARAAHVVKNGGAKFIVQLNHAGPRAIDTDDLADVSARELKKDRHARELTLAEIKAIEQAFIAAAVRLKKAGVDGVQLHAAHSYLLSRFIDPTFNLRTDEYGGNAANRFRMTENILVGIKAACGDDFPVLIKINSDTAADNDRYEEDMIYILRRAAELGAELVELSGVDFINQPRTATLYYLDRAIRLKKAVGNMPLSLVGGVRSASDMEKVLNSGIDMVSVGRPLIAEDDFVQKTLAGGEKSICVSCNRCFVIPNKHPNIRCVWQKKKARAAAQA